MDRPRNPFAPTYEPDWKASKTTPGGSHALKYDKLKHRNSYRILPNSDETQPFPLDTNRSSLKEGTALRGPNSRDSNQLSVLSTSSNVARKAAPPIPKKPALLSNRQNTEESTNYEWGTITSSRPPSRGHTTLDDGATTGFPPPQQVTKQQAFYGQQATESFGPPLPPRSTGDIISTPNDLMDDDNEGASAIPSLQPMRCQQKNPDW